MGMASLLWALSQSCGHGINLVGMASVLWALSQSCGLGHSNRSGNGKE